MKDKTQAQHQEKSPVFVTAEEAIEAYRNGEMLILIDDEDRENEGDFVMAAEFVTPDAINFMVTHGRGLVCVSITEARAKELDLPMMVSQNSALLGTAFTVSVDAVENTSTGISTSDRAETIRVMLDDDTRPEDLGRPGHIFPLVANPGGVLVRPGHTEAVVDLAKAAGCKPAGILCEILATDGTMARLPQLMALAEEFDLKIASVEDVVKYRQRNETLIQEVTDVALPSRYGNFNLSFFENIHNPDEYHMALAKGRWEKEEPVLIRVHSECMTGDTFGSLRCDCGNQLHSALYAIEENGSGVVLYLKQEGRGIGLANKLRAYNLQDQGKDTVEANEALGFKADLREYWFAVQMLKYMGITRVKLMTNNPRKVDALKQYGIDVVERVPLLVGANPSNKRYLQTKKEKLGHLIF